MLNKKNVKYIKNSNKTFTWSLIFNLGIKHSKVILIKYIKVAVQIY